MFTLLSNKPSTPPSYLINLAQMLPLKHKSKQNCMNMKICKSWIFSSFLSATAKVVFITVLIIFHLILYSTVLIYDFHIFITSSSSFHGFITNQFNNLLPVGLLAQLVERCTGIAEVKGSNPVQAWIFSGFLSTTAKVVSKTAMISFHIIILHHAVLIYDFHIFIT